MRKSGKSRAWRQLWLPNSLAHLLIAVLLLLSIVPTLALGGVAYVVVRQQRLDLLRDQFDSVLTLKEQQITVWVEDRERDLALLAGEPALRDAVRLALLAPGGDQTQPELYSGIRDRLASVLGENDQFLNLMLLAGSSGEVLISAPEDREGMAYRQHPFFRRGMNGPFVQPPVFDVSLALDAPTMVVARPILTEDGTPLGVLAGIVNLAALDQIIQESTGLGQTGTTYMINKSGFLISAGRLEGGYSYQQSVRTVGADQALSGRTGFASYESLVGQPVLGVYTWLPALESALLVEQETQEALSSLQALRAYLVVGLLGIIALMALASTLIARWITRPIITLTQTAQAIAAGDLTQRVSVEREDEVGTLARSFNSMAHQLRALVGGLEQRVEKRTAELTAANRELRREITERERAEAKVRESELKYRTLFEASTDAIFLETLEGRILDCNAPACDLYGYSKKELVELSVSDLVPEEVAATLPDVIEEELRSGGIFVEAAGVRKDGQVFPTEVRTRLVAIAGEQRLIVYVRDITERARAEETLRESEARYRSLFEESPIALWEEDFAELKRYLDDLKAAGVSDFRAYFCEQPEAILHCASLVRILDVNRATLRIFAASSKEELLGELGNVFTAEAFDVFREELIALTQGHMRFEAESLHRSLADERIHTALSLVVAPGYEQTWSKVFVSLLDITELRTAQDQIIQQERLAAVGQLAAGIAHDFNNILAGVILAADMLRHEQNLPSPAEAMLLGIKGQSQRAAHLVQQLLDFSRKSLRRLEPFDLALLLQEWIGNSQRALPAHIDVRLEMEPGSFLVHADRAQVQQILANMADRAQHAMPEGGSLTFCLSRSSLAPGEVPPVPDMLPGDWLVLTVADTGLGISAEVLSHIFEPFFTTKGVGESMGLGLAQIYGIVVQHAGHIHVASQVGKGTTFTIYLRALEVEPRAGERAEDLPRGSGETILLAMTDPLLLEASRVALQDLGYGTLAAQNSQSALELFDEYRARISLVLLDLTQPARDGTTLHEVLRQREPQTKMVIIGQHPRTSTERDLEQGIVGRIQKPFTTEQLAGTIREALGREIT